MHYLFASYNTSLLFWSFHLKLLKKNDICVVSISSFEDVSISNYSNFASSETSFRRCSKQFLTTEYS